MEEQKCDICGEGEAIKEFWDRCEKCQKEDEKESLRHCARIFEEGAKAKGISIKQYVVDYVLHAYGGGSE